MNSKTPDGTQHRRSIRLSGYDYSAPGGYYITVVTFGRECLFGEITGCDMKLSPIGEIVRREWFRTAELRPYVELHADEFVVMPNHVHGIIWIIDDQADPVGKSRYVGARDDVEAGDDVVGARHFVEDRHDIVGARRRRAPTPTEQFGKPVAGSIPTIVRAFKSAVKYHAKRDLNSANLWQPNYYEHILRDKADYERIANYISENPRNWAEDDENPGGFY